ncbi:hypothetical protein ANN_27066 [Periplaneta americana]|uniref:Uncharacterized protein n=1 Tax=Periplaneta americana TaxID=6978 RepID=A0ABQ8RX24_PERAM|nr:hypothetical protein ANN_27066 [Periplaneta americana]
MEGLCEGGNEPLGSLKAKFIPQGATVDKILYKEILGCLSNSVRRKRPELWHRKNWLLLHNNAPAHRSILVQEELARQQVAVLPHPPYSPDEKVRKHRYSTKNELQNAIYAAFQKLSPEVLINMKNRPRGVFSYGEPTEGHIKMFEILKKSPTPPGGDVPQDVEWQPIDVNDTHTVYLEFDNAAPPSVPSYGIMPLNISMQQDMLKERMEFWDSLPLKENELSAEF